MNIPAWLIALYLAIMFIPPFFGIIGLFFLARNDYPRFNLGIAAVIYAIIAGVILTVFSMWSRPGEAFTTLALPFSEWIHEFLGRSVVGIGLGSIFESLKDIAGIALNYVAVFGLVEITHRLFKRLG